MKDRCHRSVFSTDILVSSDQLTYKWHNVLTNNLKLRINYMFVLREIGKEILIHCPFKK